MSDKRPCIANLYKANIVQVQAGTNSSSISSTAIYNVYLTFLFLLNSIITKIKKIMTKTLGLFLEVGCIQLSCVKLRLINYDEVLIQDMDHY